MRRKLPTGTLGSIAFGATNFGLYRTLNGGTTWTKLTSGLPAISSTVVACCDIIIHPTNPNIVYCAFWADGVYKTTNATVATPTWTKLAGGFPAANLERIALAISPTAPNNVYAMTANPSDSFGGFYPSANDGGTWTSVAAAAAAVQVYGAYTSNVFVDISTPDIVYLSGVGSIRQRAAAGPGASRLSEITFTLTTMPSLVTPATTSSFTPATTAASTNPATAAAPGTTALTKESASRSSSSSGYTQPRTPRRSPAHRTMEHGCSATTRRFTIPLTETGDRRGLTPQPQKTSYTPTSVLRRERSTQGGKFGSYVGISGGLHERVNSY